MKIKRSTQCLLFITFLFCNGCSSVTTSQSELLQQSKYLYADHKFPLANNIVIESQDEIFAIDQEMKSMVNYILRKTRNEEEKAKLLLQYIFSSNHINISYDSYANVNAIDAFYGKKANCMSLTIMAYALGTEAGMSLKFQNVEVPEYWIRNGSQQLLMGHVNLLVTKKKSNKVSYYFSRNLLQIDFDPNAVKNNFRKTVISKNRMTAMFYNNKAADAMVDLNYNKAYAYLRAATLLDPSFAGAWGNLGIIYKHHNLNKLAIKTYQYSLELKPNDSNVLENISLLYTKLNRLEEAEKIKRFLHTKRSGNPHYHALLSDEANYRGNKNKAIKHLKKAITLENNHHEFYFNLAKLYYQTEQINLAQSAIKKAIKLNKNMATKMKYNKKLNFLNQASLRY